MRAITRLAGSMFGVLLAVSASSAQPFVTPVTRLPYPTAPDACGPGWYSVGPCGMVYGPNYYLYPPPAPPYCCNPWQPISGVPHPSMMKGMPAIPGVPQVAPCVPQQYIRPPAAQAAAPPQVYPTHPFVRSPRDFFMWNESLEEQEGRSSRPGLVP